MSNIYLVDTSTWIEGLRKGGNPEAQHWLKTVLSQEAVVIIPPVKTELLSGSLSEKQFNKFKGELEALTLLNRDDEAWEKAAELNFRLRRQGVNIPVIDVLIASWSLLYNCILVHHDRHYEMIKNIEQDLKTLIMPPFPE